MSLMITDQVLLGPVQQGKTRTLIVVDKSQYWCEGNMYESFPKITKKYLNLLQADKRGR